MKTTCGNSTYNYGKATMSKGAARSNGARKPAPGKMPAPNMGRKVMPGDAHAAMRGN